MVGAMQSLLKRSPLRRRIWTGLSLTRQNRDSSVNITVHHCCTVHILWARAQSSYLFRFWAVSDKFTAARNICVKLTKLEISPKLNCKDIADDTNNTRNSNKTCVFHSQIHISNNHSNTSIEERYNENLHYNKEKQFLIKKFWPSDEKLPDAVQFNISIDYTVSEAQRFPVDYYLISYHIKMSQFPLGQQFNPEGITQTQKSSLFGLRFSPDDME
ncbi:Hypothetical predicted protein [Octopus vulgaris]|uniref:Uncharacterized protein n=1 Tax=Octopus vulgaris TaxID=6645 RepID=A0AA36BGC9_OCTVU|nr:Hypothetical predicted protein [Octopus vulgaris]